MSTVNKLADIKLISLNDLISPELKTDTLVQGYKFRQDPDLHFASSCSNRSTQTYERIEMTVLDLIKYYLSSGNRSTNNYLDLEGFTPNYPLCKICLDQIIRSIMTPFDFDSLIHIVNRSIEYPNDIELKEQNIKHYEATKDFDTLNFLMGLYDSAQYKENLYQNALQSSHLGIGIFTRGLEKAIADLEAYQLELKKYLTAKQSDFELKELSFYLETTILTDEDLNSLTNLEKTVLFGLTLDPTKEFDSIRKTWLNSLDRTPLERLALSLEAADRIYSLQSNERDAWLKERNKILTRKINFYEKELAHILSEPPIIIFLHARLFSYTYYDRPLTSFNLFYPRYLSHSEEKVAYRLPAVFKGWVKTNRLLHRKTNNKHLMDYLHDNFSESEIQSILELWSPDTSDILSDLKKVPSVLHKL